MFSLLSDHFPLWTPLEHPDAKDPCPVFDGKIWHLYGSAGCVQSEVWEILHATSLHLEGPWTQLPNIRLHCKGDGIAAPGVIHHYGMFHMFVQTEFLRGGGTVELFTSRDSLDWFHVGTMLSAIEGGEEHGIYDPHPATIAGERYIVYSAFGPGTRKPQPDVYLAHSPSGHWDGPWVRLGKILDHDEVSAHHNARSQDDYEWGLEGAQLVELPDGRVLLNAVSFLPSGEFGSRQRVFFAIGDTPTGPFRSLGTILEPTAPGENGHAAALVHEGVLSLFYQSRMQSTDGLWRYGLANFSIDGD